jgi:putative membrane protein insertion efficiency factor
MRVNLAQHILVLVLRVYRVTVSPVLAALTVPMGMGCRFSPTCSQYAQEAVQRHGALRGGALAVRRLCRCHPWGGSGSDPVPAIPLRVSGSEFRIPGDADMAVAPQTSQASRVKS